MVTGFIGLGTMGSEVAGHLLAAGYELAVHTRTPDKAGPLVARGAHWVDRPARIAERARIVFTMVGGPDDVEVVYRGPDGLLSAAGEGHVLVDLTTSSPDLAVPLAQAAKARGAACLDAPVTGGAGGAKAGSLALMVGGAPWALEVVRPWLDCFSGVIRHFGPAGAGQHAKLANQTAVAGIMVGLAEALAYGQRVGLEGALLLASLGSGTARSFLLDAYGEKMLRGDTEVGFAVQHLVKDLGLACRSAEALDIRPRGLMAALDAYRALADGGHQHEGIQALIQLYRDGDLDGPKA